MKLLFIDVDGVLNNHGKTGMIDPACARRMQYVVEETGAKVAISSAWRYMVHNGAMTAVGFQHMMLTHGLYLDIIGVTETDEICCACGCEKVHDDVCGRCEAASTRGDQISLFLAKMKDKPSAYAVVDDLDLGISANNHPFVRTDGSIGMTEEDAGRLVSLLRD